MLCGNACQCAQGAFPLRLKTVIGYDKRVNDVVYCPPIVKNDNDNTTVVYFGGDVQDFIENMEEYRDSKTYMKYNLDNTSLLLRHKFPKCHIIIIRPSRMEYKTFSCFDNFVRSNDAGVPDHSPMHFALQHLEKLLHSISQRLNSYPVLFSSRSSPTFSSPPSSPPPSSQLDNNQEMDIDILQVQETVTVTTEETIVINCTNDSCNNSMPTIDMADDLSTNILQSDIQSTLNSTRPSEPRNLTRSQTPKLITNRRYAINLSELGVTTPTTATTTSAVSIPTSTASTSTSTTTQTISNNMSPPPSDVSDLFMHPFWWHENLNLDDSKLILIGFSKGCVVLNQFLYEFHYLKTLTPDDGSLLRLLSRINEMYWLDGGHGGARNTWITSRCLLETLSRLNIALHVHVTPYQVQDDRRPWIRKEERIFTDLLRKLGAPLTRCLHFEAIEPNLFTHFEVLQVFREPFYNHMPIRISHRNNDEHQEEEK